MKEDKIFQEDLEKALETLKSGGVILYPTDTVWGLGCDATNAKAVEKINKIKNRNPEEKSLIILTDGKEMIAQYVKEIPEIAEELIKTYDEPLTIIYPYARNLAKNVVAADNTIAIRVVKDDFCEQLIKKFGKPIVSSSANESGKPTPLYYKLITKEIVEGADYVVRINQNSFHSVKPSTIIRITGDFAFEIVRV